MARSTLRTALSCLPAAPAAGASETLTHSTLWPPAWPDPRAAPAPGRPQVGPRSASPVETLPWAGRLAERASGAGRELRLTTGDLRDSPQTYERDRQRRNGRAAVALPPRVDSRARERSTTVGSVARRPDELWEAVGQHVLPAAAERGEAPAYAAGEPAESAFLIDEASGSAADALATLDRVAQFGINQTSGGHFAFLPGGGSSRRRLATLWPTWPILAGVRLAAPAATAMERSLLRWMAVLVGYPPTAGGDLTSGASIAHLEGIVTARDAAGVRPADASETVVYVTSETHHFVEKAIRICGLAECIVREVAVDEHRRLRRMRSTRRCGRIDERACGRGSWWRRLARSTLAPSILWTRPPT